LNKQAIWVAGICTLLLAVGAGVVFKTKKASLHGAVIDPPMPAADIRLTDFSGQPFASSQLRGKVLVLYFGYTNCPDECPLTMAHLKLAMDRLGAQAANVRVVMITTDPQRDSPGALKEFLGKFRPDFIGLSGSAEELASVWRAYGVTVENGGETHSNFVYVLDTHGNLRETFLPDSLPADEASDMQLLLQE
jgi:protein SCO1